MNDCKKLADLLFPHIKRTPEEYETLYPHRKLPEGAYVTRFAPSPTGFVHLGNLFVSLIDERLAHQSGGVCYLRIEDTDKKREVENGIESIIKALSKFGIMFDEGATGADTEKGQYGPYKQSERAEIYQTFVKHLIEKDYAYPCFCSEEELNEIRRKQEEQKLTPGYYGEWAAHRNYTLEQIQQELAMGKTFVVRLKSKGNPENKIVLNDRIKGEIEFPENNQDLVILKSDGLPTYHFAHAVDDHFMRTTHVVRGDEWLSSVPLHFELFKALGWEKPQYVHVSPIMKMEDTSKRKLSKRKDPEAAVSFYHDEGYPVQAVREYLLNLINSNFEDWRRDNPDKPNIEFNIDTERMSVSGSLFDIIKLTDVSKEIISRMTTDEVFELAYSWAKEYDAELFSLISEHEAYTKQILGIERGCEKPRKDIGKWSDVKPYISYFFDELFYAEISNGYAFADNMTQDEIKRILNAYLEIFNLDGDHETWFNGIKDFCETLGYASNMKEYKKNKDAYKGNIGDVMGTIRVAIANRRTTPDLLQVMKVMGADRVKERLNKAIGNR
ncbi:MAG: glutamate--tRNA ligase [Bacillota bacterium]